MGSADDRDGPRRLRNADRASVFRLCRSRPTSCLKASARTSSARSRVSSTNTAALRRSRKDSRSTAPLLLAERFSGIAAFAHGLAFCQAVEAICGVEPPPRAQALRTVFAELERLRSHAAAITGICNSTALAVATSQAALIEESLLR